MIPISSLQPEVYFHPVEVIKKKIDLWQSQDENFHCPPIAFMKKKIILLLPMISTSLYSSFTKLQSDFLFLHKSFSRCPCTNALTLPKHRWLYLFQANSFQPSRSEFKCHILHETFQEHLIKLPFLVTCQSIIL